MKILMTGANGFIGSTLLSILTTNYEVVVIGRNRPSQISSDKFIEADLLSSDFDNNIIHDIQATHLLHLAWYTKHGAFWHAEENFDWLKSSVSLVSNFCQSRSAQKFIGIGTCAEYDWRRNSQHKETHFPFPNSIYGQAKSSLQQFATLLCEQHGIDMAWGRIFFPYGPGEEQKRLIPSLISIFLGQSEPLSVNLTAQRDFLHVVDMAHAIAALLQDDAKGIFNLCSGQAHPLQRLVNIISEILHSDPHLIIQNQTVPTSEPRILFGNNLRLKALGWQQSLSLQQGLERTIQSIVNNGKT